MDRRGRMRLIIRVTGHARSRRRMMFVAACLMLFETIPLLIDPWLAPLALLAGAGFIYLGYRIWDEDRTKATT